MRIMVACRPPCLSAVNVVRHEDARTELRRPAVCWLTEVQTVIYASPHIVGDTEDCLDQL